MARNHQKDTGTIPPLGFVDVGQEPAVLVHEPNEPANQPHASLLTRVETILGNPTEYRELLAQQGELAQSLLDLLQTLYDYPGVLPKLKSKIFHAIIRLSNKSGLYPNCLALDDVTKVGDHPVAAGGFGEIWKGLIGGRIVCLKVVKIYGNSDVQKLLKEFRKEAILWRQFSHPNVLPFLGLYFLDLSKQRICLISPWMEMGNLRQYLDKHGEGPIDYFALAFDIICGLSYLHEKKVVHGDLKGDNILITSFGRAAIADFGLARKVSESDTLRLTSLSTSHHVKGSTRWLAPECLLENGVHTYHSDIYAFGCVCYEVFTGLIPFYEFPREVSVVIQLNEGHRPSRPGSNSRLNDSMWAIMQECWRQGPDSRPLTNTLSERIVSAANQKTIDLGRDWDNSLPSLLQRNTQYPEICPSGSLVDAFLFGPRYQSTNLEQTHSSGGPSGRATPLGPLSPSSTTTTGKSTKAKHGGKAQGGGGRAGGRAVAVGGGGEEEEEEEGGENMEVDAEGEEGAGAGEGVEGEEGEGEEVEGEEDEEVLVEHQSTNLEQTHSLEMECSGSTIPIKHDFVPAISHNTDDFPPTFTPPGLMPAPPLTTPKSRPQEQPFFFSISASPLQDVKPSNTPSLTFQPHPPFSFQSPLSPMNLWERASFIPQQQHQECITNSSRTQNFSYQLNGQSMTPPMLGQASSVSASDTPYQQLLPSTAPWKKENDATSPIGIYPQHNAWSGNLFNRDNADWKSFGDDQTSSIFWREDNYVAVGPIYTAAAIPQTEPAVATRQRQNPGQKLYRCDRCSQDFTAKHNLRNHMNSHLGIKKHGCNCGRAFGTKHVLTRHQKTCDGVTKRKFDHELQSSPGSSSGL